MLQLLSSCGLSCSTSSPASLLLLLLLPSCSSSPAPPPHLPPSEYYFSPDNLQRDFFLRRKMTPEGFLPASLIASFNRVQQLSQVDHPSLGRNLHPSPSPLPSHP